MFESTIESSEMELEAPKINNDAEITPLDASMTPKLCTEPVEDVQTPTDNSCKFSVKTYWFPEKTLEEGDSIKTPAVLKYPKLKAMVGAPNEAMANILCAMKDYASKAFDHASEAATSAVTMIQAQSAKALDNFNGYIDRHRETQPPKER
ncbi:unnamed protein product [Arctia plantaginis]|uniref:Uncharacterized protein n=1 Tax=Arctia plantaginis TaxID=874455 RepID=A0A8S0ZDQ5_ARCPL|nr:unnamed protein product [Arctia plantaginis]CAB3248097.1 unnamed protein product [Arctia plantaginis]